MELALPENGFARAERCIDAKLESQDVRIEWFAEVVDAADGVAALYVRVFAENRRHEDDGDVLERVDLLDRRRRLESIHARHLDIEQDDVDIRLLL